MCGILAVLSNKTPKNLRTILQSSLLLKARGPDSCGSYIQKNGIYIFRRLAINDMKDGNQPFFTGPTLKTITMCNGEIYNHEKIREKFDIKCDSNSDCEVIPKLYEKLGFVEKVKKLDGYFA